MAVGKKASSKKTRYQFYGMGIFDIHTKCNLTNKERKAIGMFENTEKDEATGQRIPKEKKYIYQGYTQLWEDGQPLKDENGEKMMEKNPYKTILIEMYAKLQPAYIKSLAIPADVKQQLENKWFVFNYEVANHSRKESGKGNGNKQWTNSTGRFTWAIEENDINTQYGFSLDGVRRAMTGEEDLIENLPIIIGINKGSEVGTGLTIDNWGALEKGDFTEINDMLETVKDNAGYKGFIAMISLDKANNGNIYQKIYKKCLTYGGEPSAETIAQYSNKTISAFAIKGWYNNEITTLRVYKGELSADVPNVEGRDNTDSVEQVNNDDLPF